MFSTHYDPSTFAPSADTSPLYRDLTVEDAIKLGFRRQRLHAVKEQIARFAAGDAELHLRRWLANDRARHPEIWHRLPYCSIDINENLRQVATDPPIFESKTLEYLESDPQQIRRTTTLFIWVDNQYTITSTSVIDDDPDNCDDDCDDDDAESVSTAERWKDAIPTIQPQPENWANNNTRGL